ncbi:hypothetical protein ACHAXR_012116 [Thalassiosira sp. AJA248-18]
MSAIQQPPGWIDSENLDCQISEACQLYGISKLECTSEYAAKSKTNGEADSIISEDSETDEVPLQDRVNSKLYIVRETDSGQTLWKCSIKESDTIANHIVAADKLSYRLPCHSFRSMLPPLVQGQPLPNRSPSWLRSCMRGVLFDALLQLASHDICANRLCFPEHVYCWFSSTDKEDQSSDEDSWAFFHGLKLSAGSNPECWLIYNLLDDMQGEDFFSYLASAMEKIQNLMGKSWELQFGEVITSTKAIESKSQLMDAFQQRGNCLEGDQTRENVWIPVEICAELTNTLFYSDQIKSSQYVDDVSNYVTEMATDIAKSLLWDVDILSSTQDGTSTSTLSVDFFTYLQMVMKTYLSHRTKQVILIRLKFETASKAVLTVCNDAQDDNTSNHEGLININQLYQILKTTWPSISLKETAMIYREAYEALYPPSRWNKPAPHGINFQSFLVAAKRLSLFIRHL